jgi:protein SCO1/2
MAVMRCAVIRKAATKTAAEWMIVSGLVTAGSVLLMGCSRTDQTANAGSARTSADFAAKGSNQVFQVKGVIKELKPDGKTVVIRHEEVPNYMPAMTMPFEAKPPGELKGLAVGDQVEFRMTVTDNDVWIDQLRKIGAGTGRGSGPGSAAQSSAAATTNSPSASTPTASLSGLPTNTGPFQIMRDLDPLQIGDRLPEYHFTNEQGQAVNTLDFKGQAVAITFIFTRCPLPNFCPRMSTNFEEAQRKLLSMANAPTNWHLLTISFDPEFDTPVILKSYAQRYKADPQHWNFLTGPPAATAEIADQFGQRFWREEGAINHNLRTVVIDATGRVQQMFQGNTWTVDDLVSELIKAAQSQGK